MKDSRVPPASPREGKGAEAEWKMITQFSKQIPGSSVSSANHRPKRAVCLSPFVWSFLGSELCSDRIVLQPVCTLVYKTICSRWPWSSCRPVLEPLRQERSSWVVHPFPNTSLPGISSALKCVLIYTFTYLLFWAGRFDTFIPYFSGSPISWSLSHQYHSSAWETPGQVASNLRGGT